MCFCLLLSFRLLSHIPYLFSFSGISRALGKLDIWFWCKTTGKMLNLLYIIFLMWFTCLFTNQFSNYTETTQLVCNANHLIDFSRSQTLVMDVLTHLFPMHPFSTPWKQQKTCLLSIVLTIGNPAFSYVEDSIAYGKIRPAGLPFVFKIKSGGFKVNCG